MKELSIFIDESGDFGEITERPAYLGGSASLINMIDDKVSYHLVLK